MKLFIVPTFIEHEKNMVYVICYVCQLWIALALVKFRCSMMTGYLVASCSELFIPLKSQSTTSCTRTNLKQCLVFLCVVRLVSEAEVAHKYRMDMKKEQQQ